MTNIVNIEVSGLTGSGKSAVYTEIATALAAIGLKVEHKRACEASSEMRQNGLDELIAYNPLVVMSERNISRAQPDDIQPVPPRNHLFRFWRWLTGRDNCEVCAGRDGVRGNENIIGGVVMCDYCHAKTF